MRLAAALVAATLMQGPEPGFRLLDRGGQSGIEDARRVVVTSPSEFDVLWREHTQRPRPAVDFTKESVVAIFLGTRPTAGYGVEIVSIDRSASGALVHCRETAPPPGAMTAQVLTFPFVIAAVPPLTPPVRVECVR